MKCRRRGWHPHGSKGPASQEAGSKTPPTPPRTSSPPESAGICARIKTDDVREIDGISEIDDIREIDEVRVTNDVRVMMMILGQLDNMISKRIRRAGKDEKNTEDKTSKKNEKNEKGVKG